MSTSIKPTNASLSTMWAINSQVNMNQFLQVSRELGFQKIELNHQINSVMLSQVDWDHFQLSSIHEPCPADISTKDLVSQDWLISSTNEDARQRGVQAVKNSIRLAAQLGAPVVVIHCGNATSDTGYEAKLRSLFNSGGYQSAEYLAIQQKAVQFRAGIVGPRLKAVKNSLLELIEFTKPLGVRLGLENRYHYMDIPLMGEMAELLELADSPLLGFIYDVGHAQALDRLGFFPHEEWLMRYSSRMFGCHLHDVSGITDHQAPGLGEIDFRLVASYLPSGAFRTLEIQPGNTIAQIIKGIQLLVDCGCLNYL